MFTGSDMNLTTGQSMIFMYDSSQSRWVSVVVATTGGASTPIAPTIQKFTSGSGTYTTATGALYVRVKMVGAGGGGGGSGTAPGTEGVTGADTTFGSSLMVCHPGHGGVSRGGDVSNGGTASLGSGPIGLVIAGSQGQGGGTSGINVRIPGGNGGTSPLGGAGGGGSPAIGTGNGGSAVANSGSGGGGAASDINAGNNAGAGGASGGYIDAIITSPSATYSYSIGGGGTAGTGGGTNGYDGGNGGSGYIEVTEYYQ